MNHSKLILPNFVTALFAVLLIGLPAFAQTKTIDEKYYVTHEKELEPDALAAFQDRNYDRVIEMCRWNYVLTGTTRMDGLRDKAQQCAKLTIEMDTLLSIDQVDAAAVKAEAILALNPNDSRALRVYSRAHSTGELNGHEWVNLGLSVRWATCNVGASSADGQGDRFAWGETEPKSEYSQENYKFWSESDEGFTKYNAWGDGKTRLDALDDAASANWGEGWRLPTQAEQDELREKCSWSSVTVNGTTGYQVTGPNGNSIFLPFADGKGHYWSSSLVSPFYACSLYLDMDTLEPKNSIRTNGRHVRPVCVGEYGENIDSERIDIVDDIVNDDIKLDDDVFMNLEDDNTGVEIIDYTEVVEEEVEEEAIPFELTEAKPSFNGGDANEFSKWVNSQLVYPKKAKEHGIQGRVTLQFTIEKDGRLRDVKVLSAPDKSLAKEAVRVVSRSPKWTPGKQRDRAVRVTYTFPVIFQLR